MAPRDDPSSSLVRPALNRLHSSGKASLMSHPSFEADDERSSLASDLEMDHDHSEQDGYEDEDTRPTSQKELAGWYSYGWAAEVFVVCAMSSFLPITLEQLARDRGVLLSDKTTSCVPTWKGPTASSASAPKPAPSCVVFILGVEVNTASFAMYTFSISVLVQSLLVISMSGAADHGRFRKTFLLGFAVVGAVATMLFLAVTSQLYLLGALLAIVANTCFGASFVLLNSFLPLLVRYHPSVQPVMENGHATEYYHDQEHHSDADDEDEDGRLDSPTTYLLPRDRPDRTPPMDTSPAAISPALKLSTKISSYGIGIGYTAALLVQIVGMVVVSTTGQSTFSLRLVLFIIGAWWLVFTIPTALWLRPRPGPPLPTALTGDAGIVGYVTYAWKALFKTISHARKLKDIVIFLGAWFLLSDSIATVSGTAILFAKNDLNMKVEALALISVIATISGIAGALSWSSLSRKLNLRASQTIIACICLFEVVPLYGLLGFIPAVQRLGYLGLQQPAEMYFLGAIYGFVMGGLSSYCRSFFGELIPPGFEAAFYALYAITDKGSSIFGPAVVGAITNHYGNIRPAFVFLAILIFLPLPLMLLVDIDRGKAEAKAMAAELEGKEHHVEYDRRPSPIPRIQFPDDDHLT